MLTTQTFLNTFDLRDGIYADSRFEAPAANRATSLRQSASGACKRGGRAPPRAPLLTSAASVANGHRRGSDVLERRRVPLAYGGRRGSNVPERARACL